MNGWIIKNYKSIDDFRGKLSKNKLTSNPFVYKRAQYVELLLNSEEIFEVPDIHLFRPLWAVSKRSNIIAKMIPVRHKMFHAWY